ncbi:hypothetical protein DPMN_000505 [Dreissena polymorpha]|uniref:Uncharacterized protein n=1 Tax=Dreissena polymorpha TaxID=45954 RepID=A0A9D4MJV6_DREPO|nr:hypothetical protein DPMN_000505 [Dreissena polymorpha]
MQLADKHSVLKEFLTQPIHVQLGKLSSREGICVAPISDEMLLGHDLLRHFNALIDLHSDCLLVNGESIPLNTTFRDKPVVEKVIMSKRKVVPPNSVVRVPCNLEGKLGAYNMEPVNNLHVLMSVIRATNEDPVVCLENPSDHFKTIKKKAVVGNAYEFEEVLEGGDQQEIPAEGIKLHTVADVDHCSTTEHNRNPLGMSDAGYVSQTREPETLSGCYVESDMQKREKEVFVPCHLHEVYKASIGKLTEEQAGALTGALFSEEVDDDIGLIKQGSFRTRGHQTTYELGLPSGLSDVPEVKAHGAFNRMESASQLDSYPWDPGGRAVHSVVSGVGWNFFPTPTFVTTGVNSRPLLH